MDREAVRRYVTAAEAGLVPAGGEEQLTDEFLTAVVEKVRPHRLDGHGEARRLLEQHQDQIKVRLEVEDLTVAKAQDLLARQGVVVPARMNRPGFTGGFVLPRKRACLHFGSMTRRRVTGR